MANCITETCIDEFMIFGGSIVKMKISTAIAYGTAWIATSVVIGFAIKYTGSASCLWALLFPASIGISVKEGNVGDD